MDVVMDVVLMWAVVATVMILLHDHLPLIVILIIILIIVIIAIIVAPPRTW